MSSRYKVVSLLPLIVVLLMFSQTVRFSVINSLELSFRTTIPALFPYFILSGLLLDFGIDCIFPPSIAALMIGLVCGFPLGSRCVVQMYQEKRLTKRQAQSLLTCTANASPAFVVCIVGETILESRSMGYLLLLIQWICSISLYLLNVPEKFSFPPTRAKNVSILDALLRNIRASVEQILFVIACTIVFGIISDIVRTIGFPNFFCAQIELMHSVVLFDNATIYALAFVLGFSGFSIIVQCAHFVRQSNLPIRFLLLGKVCSGIWMPLLLATFQSREIGFKIVGVIIFVLTNALIACIIKLKGCEKENDFFKRSRKMLCLLRARHKNFNA